jgi:hypothetical protein
VSIQVASIYAVSVRIQSHKLRMEYLILTVLTGTEKMR